MNNTERNLQHEEIILNAKSGMAALFFNSLMMLASIGLFIWGVRLQRGDGSTAIVVMLIVLSLIYFLIIGPIFYCGLKVIKPNEALVLTFFGRYSGTLKKDGFFFVNPFMTSYNPAKGTKIQTLEQTGKTDPTAVYFESNKISLRTLTLSSDRQKINDELGNPVIVGIVVIWRVINTAKAVFNVDNYKEFLAIQCNAVLRDIVQLYPYDAYGSDCERSLRGSHLEIAQKLREEIQSKVDVAGLEIVETGITHLSYAPEIASVMLQRQQASALIDAKQLIVEASVGMVEMALEKLEANDRVHLDEERKAAMVSNLLVVLCGSKEAQPVVNSGSLY